MSVDQIPIGRFSHITRLSLKALRLYDSKGLLVPEAKDQITGYRYYSFSQIDTGVKLKRLAGLGFGLEDCKALLDAEEGGDRETIRTLLQRRRQEVVEERNRLVEVEACLLTQEKNMEVVNVDNDQPIIKDVPEIRVLSKRARGRYDEVVPRLFGELFGIIHHPDNQKAHVKITGTGLALCYDLVYEENDADIEMAIPVSGRVTLTDEEAQLRVLPATEVVSLIHKGSYYKLHESYSRIMKFMEEKGLAYVPPDRELYLSNPKEVAEEEVLTEIQLPFKKKTEE